MAEDQKYKFHMEPCFDFLDLIDVPALIAKCKDKWVNYTLCKVNDHLIRLGVFNEGEFHMHKHEADDEFFFVLQGELFIELEDKTVSLKPHQGFTVPKGVLHRPYVKEPTAIIMVESDSIAPAGSEG